MKEDYQDIDVPPWAIRLILDEEDLSLFKKSFCVRSFFVKQEM